MDKKQKIKELTEQLNNHRDLYYNDSQSAISDKEYDSLFDELSQLENETGFKLSNSPTQTIGYEVKSRLQKVKHNHPMLSLDKTKDIEKLKGFIDDEEGILMLKLDGLTISLRYLNGKLISAETRGNGEEGEDVLHTVKTFTNVPMTIDFKDELIVDGEAIITYDTFRQINEKLPKDEKYKNPRNLASGSVRQLDSNIAAERKIKFVAWKCAKGIKRDDIFFSDQLDLMSDFGFEIVPYYIVYSISDFEYINNYLKDEADKLSYPIDGLVLGFNSIKYGESLGMTGHHLRSQIAYKFYDEEVETTLKGIDWTMGKTGVLTPTAIFEPVEIDGTTVERASLHNVSIFENLRLGIGDNITVYKANQIIPQVKENLSKDASSTQRPHEFCIISDRFNGITPPDVCPICGSETKIKRDNDSRFLMCSNPYCKGKLLKKFSHFVSKNAMNVDNLSEATLNKFIELGWLKEFKDLYSLNTHYDAMIKLDGFGKRKADKLLTAIDNSKNTTFDRFIYALSIPLIGRTASKRISKYCNGSITEFLECCVVISWTILEDFGDAMDCSLKNYTQNNFHMMLELSEIMSFNKSKTVVVTDDIKNLSGKVFVVTGSLNHFENRDAVKEEIEMLGGKVSGSVSAKTSCLVNNDISSTSGKNKKAKELGVPIITEEQLLQMIR